MYITKNCYIHIWLQQHCSFYLREKYCVLFFAIIKKRETIKHDSCLVLENTIYPVLLTRHGIIVDTIVHFQLSFSSVPVQS